jgi:hypothetical protein
MKQDGSDFLRLIFLFFFFIASACASEIVHDSSIAPSPYEYAAKEVKGRLYFFIKSPYENEVQNEKARSHPEIQNLIKKLVSRITVYDTNGKVFWSVQLKNAALLNSFFYGQSNFGPEVNPKTTKHLKLTRGAEFFLVVEDARPGFAPEKYGFVY